MDFLSVTIPQILETWFIEYLFFPCSDWIISIDLCLSSLILSFDNSLCSWIYCMEFRIHFILISVLLFSFPLYQLNILLRLCFKGVHNWLLGHFYDSYKPFKNVCYPCSCSFYKLFVLKHWSIVSWSGIYLNIPLSWKVSLPGSEHRSSASFVGICLIFISRSFSCSFSSALLGCWVFCIHRGQRAACRSRGDKKEIQFNTTPSPGLVHTSRVWHQAV